MHEADLIPGVREFFQTCIKNGIQTYIISHKTEYANFDEVGINLREAALNWMTQQGVFEASGFGLVKANVFFGTTRLEKIVHIENLGCTHFIDDLEEMFIEAAFPAEIEKILYVPHGQHASLPGIRTARSWQEINDFFFNTAY